MRLPRSRAGFIHIKRCQPQQRQYHLVHLVPVKLHRRFARFPYGSAKTTAKDKVLFFRSSHTAVPLPPSARKSEASRCIMTGISSTFKVWLRAGSEVSMTTRVFAGVAPLALGIVFATSAFSQTPAQSPEWSLQASAPDPGGRAIVGPGGRVLS